MSAPSVLVAGGGPAGLTVARLLALRGWSTTVVDPLLARRQRLELAAPAVIDAFRAAGIDALLEDERIARPCLGICRRWDDDEGWSREPFFTHRGGKGFVLDRQALDLALRMRADQAGVSIVHGRLVGIAPVGNSFTARLASSGSTHSTTASLVIDATGRPAAVGRRLGARRIGHGRHFATPRALPALPQDRTYWLNIQGSDDEWSYQLEGPAGSAEAWQVSSRRPSGPDSVDASTSRLQPPVGLGWVAIGDAAAAFNPIWSQGLSHALGSAITIAGALLSEGSVTQTVRDVYAVAVEESMPAL